MGLDPFVGRHLVRHRLRRPPLVETGADGSRDGPGGLVLCMHRHCVHHDVGDHGFGFQCLHQP